MQLKLKRSKTYGVMGDLAFKLFAIVDLDEDEQRALTTYGFGSSAVYRSPEGEAAAQNMRRSGSIRSMLGFASAKMRNQILTVNDLVKGKEIICSDITDMLAAEEQVREGCESLSQILYACQTFEGEEIIDIRPFEPCEATG